ncbi:putative phosphoglycerate mutase [Curtobacterium pusillum]|uniref:Phosphoglycerate mutase n=1 Tax=Curtobacterium pusillum TaxID=69373 RepID=A0AAW3TB12_9MICO|nr:putative phosphoglycerate mutase [Curtobacterium pusillum]
MTDLTRRTVLTTGALAVGTSVLAAAEPAAANPTSGAGRGRVPDTRTTTVYLVRHGQTWLNKAGLAQGWSDAPLTTTWAPTAQTIGRNIAQRHGRLTAAYSADMVRHFQTASGILQGARSSLQVTRDERLREVAFGGFEGSAGTTMWDAAAALLGYSGMAAALAAGRSVFDLVDAIPNANPYPADTVAEKSATVAARMLAALEDVVSHVSNVASPAILVVSSGLSISCLFDAWGQASRLPAAGIGNGAVNQLTHSRGRWTVDSVNDLSYTS